MSWRVLDRRFIIPSAALLLIMTGIVAVTAPAEQTLGGANARLVYFHGALVWASILTWMLSGAVGVWARLAGTKAGIPALAAAHHKAR